MSIATPAAPAPGAPAVDVRAARLSQGAVAALVAAAAALGSWPLLLVPAAHLALAAALGRRGNAVVRAFDAWLRPRLGAGALEDARPPRFASLLGAVFLSAALLAHAAGATVLGWALALAVGALALVASSTGACLGCWAYGYLGPLRGLLRRLG
ncbi:MAG TPA: DUF4395 family protein [Anaeromyxobacter sp.]|nr:DUF4395 family protein [Anaeromyxobacter sp.]